MTLTRPTIYQKKKKKEQRWRYCDHIVALVGRMDGPEIDTSNSTPSQTHLYY
jgi:hypothetical protein